jgi:hypothetical protein
MQIKKKKNRTIRRIFKMCFENAFIFSGCQLIQSILYYKLIVYYTISDESA